MYVFAHDQSSGGEYGPSGRDFRKSIKFKYLLLKHSRVTTRTYLCVFRKEHTTDRLRKIDGFFRQQSSGIWEIRRDCRYNKYFTRFGIAITSSGTPHTTNGEFINQRSSNK